MSQNRAAGHAGDRAADKMQVRAANCARGQTHNGVQIILNFRLAHLLQSDVANIVKYDGLHRILLPFFLSARPTLECRSGKEISAKWCIEARRTFRLCKSERARAGGAVMWRQPPPVEFRWGY